MEYIYSAMLLHSAGQKITEEHVKKVLTAAGVKVDEGRVKALVASLDGVNIDEAIKTAAIPVAAAPAAPAGGKAEEKKEENLRWLSECCWVHVNRLLHPHRHLYQKNQQQRNLLLKNLQRKSLHRKLGN